MLHLEIDIMMASNTVPLALIVLSLVKISAPCVPSWTLEQVYSNLYNNIASPYARQFGSG